MAKKEATPLPIKEAKVVEKPAKSGWKDKTVTFNQFDFSVVMDALFYVSKMPSIERVEQRKVMSTLTFLENIK